MKNFKFSRLFAAAVFVAVLGLSGCKNVVQNNILNNGVVGTWVESSSYGTSFYEIKPNTFTNKWQPTGGAVTTSYAGSNVVVMMDDATSGRIFIKYTRAMNADYTYSETAPDVGKWYALSFKNLTPYTMKISGAYKDSTSGGVTSCTTLDAAITEFTLDNGYFGTYSDVVKQ